MTPTSLNVQADAQFTMGQVLRPFPNFEASYQGKDATIPIAFPGTLDESAGKSGYSPYLLKGIAVPMGAKVQLWFPVVSQSTGGEAPELTDYVYLLHWRIRTVVDFARAGQLVRSPYHLGKADPGAPDTFLAPSSPKRFVLPSAVETVFFQQTETTGGGPGVGNLRTELIAVPSDLANTGATAGLPLLPPNSAPPFANAFPGSDTTPLGAFQQGVIDPASDTLAPYSIFRPYFTIAKGDELLITVVRNTLVTPPSPDTWDFSSGGLDEAFSNLYGINAAGPTHPPFEDCGIYLFTGSNPS